MNKSKSAILVILIMLISPLVLTGCSKGGKNYNNGVSAFEDGDYKTAAEEFSEAITLNPDSGDYFIAYGDTLLMQENYEEAVNIYNQVITDKDNTIVKQNNKRAYYGKGVAYYNMAEYDKAIKQFDLASSVDELEDLDLDILLYKGNTQLDAGLYEDAVSTYTLAIGIDSKDTNIYYNRSMAYKELEDYSNAEADMNTIISLEPDNYEYYFDYYFLLEDQNKLEQANEILDNITRIKIEDQVGFFNNAKANFYLGNYSSANEGFLKAVTDGILEANYYLARIKEQEEDYEGAISYYEEFLNINFDEYFVEDYYISLGANQAGYCYIQVEEFEKALEKLDKGLELDIVSTNQALLSNKVVALEGLGDYEEAYKVLQKLVARYPEDEDILKELEFVKTRLPGATIEKGE